MLCKVFKSVWRWAIYGLNETSRIWKYTNAKHRSGKWEDVESIFVESRRMPIYFSPYHFWFGGFKVQDSPCLFLEGEEESMLSGDQVHMIPCLLRSKVYAIHNFGAQVMKLQGTIFLLPAIDVFQPAFCSKLHLNFPHSTWRSPFCLLPDCSISLDVSSKDPQSNQCSHLWIYLLFSLQGNPLDQFLSSIVMCQ